MLAERQEEFQKDKDAVDGIMRRIENEDREERNEKIRAQQQVQGYIRDFLQEQQQLKQQTAKEQQDEENRSARSELQGLKSCANHATFICSGMPLK